VNLEQLADVEKVRPGDVVRAAVDLYFVVEGVDVAAGTLGRVVATRVRGCFGLFSVRWDGIEGELVTAFVDCLERVPS